MRRRDKRSKDGRAVRKAAKKLKEATQRYGFSIEKLKEQWDAEALERVDRTATLERIYGKGSPYTVEVIS